MIYTKTRELLQFDERELIKFAFGAFGEFFIGSVRVLPRDEVYGLAIQLKTTRTIRRVLDFSIRVLRPNRIIAEEHPSRFYCSFRGKSLLRVFQPLLRFRKLLLQFEALVYAGYFGQISGEHYEILRPHPDYFYDEYKTHCLAPVQQGDAIGAARPQSGPLHIDKYNAQCPTNTPDALAVAGEKKKKGLDNGQQGPYKRI